MTMTVKYGVSGSSEPVLGLNANATHYHLRRGER